MTKIKKTNKHFPKRTYQIPLKVEEHEHIHITEVKFEKKKMSISGGHNVFITSQKLIVKSLIWKRDTQFIFIQFFDYECDSIVWPVSFPGSVMAALPDTKQNQSKVATLN